jgi:hypothetical protein
MTTGILRLPTLNGLVRSERLTVRPVMRTAPKATCFTQKTSNFAA